MIVGLDSSQRAQPEQELKNVRTNAAKDGHSLQKFDPRFAYGGFRQ
jgi:hypothetical protein